MNQPQKFSEQRQPEESNWFQNGLIKILFKDLSILSANATVVISVPEEHQQEILSTIKFVHCYTQFNEVSRDQSGFIRENYYVPPIKLGEPFYLQFFFLDKYLYYDDKEGKFMLSSTEKTVFKIMSRVKVVSYDSKASKKQQALDSIGKIKFDDFRYHIIMAEQTICLKSNGSSIYPGNYDEKAQLSIIPSLFSNQNNSIYNSPCLLYSLEEEKYVLFDFKSSQMKLSSSKIFIQGLCRLQKEKKGVMVRVMQLNNNHYLSAHLQNQLNEEVMNDLSKMLKNLSLRQIGMDSFASKRQQSLSAQKLSFGGISGIAFSPFTQGYADDVREDLIANISIKHFDKKRTETEIDKQFLFKTQAYKSGQVKRNIFLYKQSENTYKNLKSQNTVQSRIEYCLDIALPSKTFRLRQSNRVDSFWQKNKFRNLFRVQVVGRQHFVHFVSFYALYLNISLFDHYKNLGKIQLNISELTSILQDLLHTFQMLQEHQESELEQILLQLADLSFLTLLWQTISAVMQKMYPDLSQNDDQWIEKVNHGQQQSVNLAIKLIIVLIRLISFKMVLVLLQEKVLNLLQKLARISLVYKQLIKINQITADEPEALIRLIEDRLKNSNSQVIPGAHKLCSLWGIAILRKYKMRSQRIQNACISLAKSKYQVINSDALLLIELKQLLNIGSSFVKQIMPFLHLEQLKNEEIEIELRESYLNMILNGYRREIRLPLVLNEHSQLGYLLQRYKLNKQNKTVLMTYLQEILPERSQVELVENKIISFGLVQLYLELEEDIYELGAEQEHNKIKTLGALISHLENNISVYRYELELEHKYLLAAINTLYRTYSQYIKQLIYNELFRLPHGTHQELLQSCLSQWQLFVSSKSVELQEFDINNNQSFPKNAAGNKESRRVKFKKKIRRIRHKIFGTISKITDVLFQKQSLYLVNGIDREYIWSLIDGKYDYVTLNQRVSIFQQVIQLVSLQTNPSALIKEEFNNLYNAEEQTFSNQFIQVLMMVIDKTYLHTFWHFIELLNTSLTRNAEWRIFIALFNKNKLLNYFLTISQNKEKQPQKMNSLFSFLLNLSRKYLQFTRDQDEEDIKTRLIQRQYYSLELKSIQIKHECEPQNFLRHLKLFKPSYEKSEVQLHYHLICSLGVIINQQYYEFYQQYIIRYQCQHYSKQLIQLILSFFQSLPKIYKQMLANALSYSYFKQHQQIKDLVIKLSEITQSPLVELQDNDLSISKRPSNFKFLLALDNSEQSMHKKSWGDNGSELLSLLFQLFTEITQKSTNAKDFASKIGYNLFYSIADTFKGNLQLKGTLCRFLCCHVRKSFLYMKENYAQEQKDNKRLIKQNEQMKYFIEWIKGTNSFLYNQIQFFKKLNCSRDQLKFYFNYIVILIQKIQLREEIAEHFMPNRAEKVKHQRGSHQSSEDSVKLSFQAKDIRQSIFGQNKDCLGFGKNNTNENDFSNISEINQMLALEMIEKVQHVLTDEEITAKIGDLFFWLQNAYGISLNKMASSLYQQKNATTFLLCLSNQQELKEARGYSQAESNDGNFEKINDFLRPRIENYLVLLIQLLQRSIVLFYHAKSSFTFNENARQQIQLKSKLINILNLIELCLQDEIIIYQELDKANQKRLYQTLPFKFNQISDFQKRRLKQKTQGTQSQKCCKLDYSHIDIIFKLLMKCFAHKDHEIVSHLHIVLQKTALYNIQNQINLQKIIQKHYSTYFQIAYEIIKHFKLTSPLVSLENFVFYDLFYHQKCHLYGNSLIMSPPSARSSHLKVYADQIRETRGIVYYRNELKYFRNTMNMFIAVSKYLNFNFKQLLSQSTIDKQSLLYQLLDLLEQTVLDNMSVVTVDKLQLIECVIKLIISFLRGPIQPNIQICVEKLYYARVLKHLLSLSYTYKESQQQVKTCLLRIRKTVAQTLFILNPYMPQGQIQIRLIEQGLKNAYFQSRKLYQGNYQDIIIDYNNPAKRLEESLLFFDLALHFFYCLIDMYSITGNNMIKKMQIAILKNYEQKKKHQETWMVFYQIYRLLADMVSAFKKTLSSTYEDLTLQEDDEQLLRKAVQFFSKHVGNIDVKIEGKIKTISFLLLKQAKCRTRSIRNQLHRWVKIDQRALRLNNFLAVSKFIILRLQIQASVTKVIQNIKPLEIIVKNRQLWKSISFAIVVVINIIYIFSHFFGAYFTGQELQLIVTVLLSMIYLFQAFLIMVYVVQIIPFKVKVYKLINRDSFKASSILTFLKDKTLFYTVFYLIFVSLSFWNLAWISIMTVDYFFRFKTSDSITYLLYRCLVRILLIILLIVFMVFTAGVIQIATGVQIYGCSTPAACSQQNFAILMSLTINVFSKSQYITSSILVGHFAVFLLRIFLKGMLVGLTFSEQKVQNDRKQQLNNKIRNSCYICGLTRNEIQKTMRTKDGFYMHLRMEHNLWNYIYYLIYLKNRDKKDLNSIESLIVQKWNNNEIDWLPDQLRK